MDAAPRGPRRRGARGDALALLAGLSLRTAAAGDIFAQAVPPCAGEALLSFEAYRGSPRRERFFHRHQWAIVLLRRLHGKAISQAGAAESEAGLFYLPAFFGLLLALNDGESAGCLVEAMGSLAATGAFRRNAGYDHFYLHGLEQPVAADFDYAEARWRPDEAAAGLARAVYATLQNVAVVATGDLAQGGLGASMGGALYSMRRVVTAPFVFAEDCAEAGGGRSVRLAFVGSVQSYNYERVRFLEAVRAEFGGRLRSQPGGRLALDDPRLQLRVRARLDPHEEPLNATERGRLGVPGRWVRSLYRRSELCVVAPGDASVLGQRLSDAVAAGCVPVVLVGPGSYPVLPLQGPIPWEEFVFVVRLGSAGAARLALRRLLKMSASSIEQRRGALERWRPRLALPVAGSSCGEGPDAGDLVLEELRALQPLWRRQLPGGTLELNASGCPRSGLLDPHCGALAGLLPQWPAPAEGGF